jgi:hypothetical protein
MGRKKQDAKIFESDDICGIDNELHILDGVFCLCVIKWDKIFHSLGNREKSFLGIYVLYSVSYWDKYIHSTKVFGVKSNRANKRILCRHIRKGKNVVAK